MALTLLALYAALVVLNSLDGISTWKVLKPGHINRERNPLARRLFLKLGIPRGIVVAELLWIGFITLIFFLAWRDPVLSVVLLVLLGIGVAIFSLVVIGNFRAWGRIRRREQLLAKTQAAQGENAERTA